MQFKLDATVHSLLSTPKTTTKKRESCIKSNFVIPTQVQKPSKMVFPTEMDPKAAFRLSNFLLCCVAILILYVTNLH